jgi:WD40 repeat protein
MSIMNEEICPECGSALRGLPSEGLCPGCLLGGVLERAAFLDSAPQPDDPAALRRCGEYEILGLLARGGMGVVLRARKFGLSREVALKMIATADLAAPDEVRRFRLEAELIAQLDHPNIVPVYDLGEHDGRPFFVMKLAEGGTLLDRLPLTGPPSAAVEIMLKVARAVHFAHEHGVLHRDLKPANILLDASGEPLVSDFGLARLANNANASFATGTGVGTPAYMAPEQALGSHAVTTVSDVYGLGAVLYHLLTSRPPFTGSSALAVLRLAETTDPMDPAKLNASVDRDLATICLKCLEKKPIQRYRSAAALADDLERWQRGEPVMARRASMSERLWKWTKRRPALATLYFTGVLGLTTLAAVLVGGNILLRDERNHAQAQEGAAKLGTARAEASEQAMRLNVYSADMFLARRALDDGHLGVARQTLERHVPSAGSTDLRGYEWHALNRQCRGDDDIVLTGHSAAVLAVAWSPDGTRVATGGMDGLLKIWQVSDGSLLQELPNKLRLSKFGELTLLANLPLRSPETEALLIPGSGVSVDEVRMRASPSSVGELQALAWSPDGTLLATAGLGAYVRLWKTSDWSYQGFLPIKTCSQLAFTMDQQLVVAVAGSRTTGSHEIRLYDQTNLRRLRTWTGMAPNFALAGPARLLAHCAETGRVEIHDLATGTLKQSLNIQLGTSAMAMSGDGKLLAALHGRSGSLWQVDEGRLIAGFSSAAEGFQCLALSSDGSILAASGAAHIVQLFNGHDGSPLRSMRGHEDELLALAFSPNGKLLVSSSTDQTARLWSPVPTVQSRPEIPEVGKLIMGNPQGSALLANAKDGTVHCWNTAEKSMTSTPNDAHRVALHFSKDSDQFCTLQEKSGLLEWWHPDGTPAGPAIALPMPTGTVYASCASQGWIAMAPPKQPATLFDCHTGMQLRACPKTPLKISRLLSSPDGRWLVATEWPRNLILFDTTTGLWGSKRRITPGVAGPIVFSPDCKLLATSGSDNLVTVWEPESGQMLASLRGHKSEVKALAFTSDSRTLASSGNDGTIHLWHTPTWRELGPLHRGALCTSLVFTPQGLVAEEYDRRWLLLQK